MSDFIKTNDQWAKCLIDHNRRILSPWASETKGKREADVSSFALSFLLMWLYKERLKSPLLYKIPHVVKFSRSAPRCNGSSPRSTGLIISQEASRCTTHLFSHPLPLIGTLSRGLAAYMLLPTALSSACSLWSSNVVINVVICCIVSV